MLKRFISSLLSELPKRIKRQIFFVSFVALFKGATSFDKEAFQKLNNVLHLAEKDEAEFGASVILAKVIWYGQSTYEICKDNVMEGSITADRISTIVSNILNATPKWLLYGTAEEIEQDVAVILQERMEILSAS